MVFVSRQILRLGHIKDPNIDIDRENQPGGKRPKFKWVRHRSRAEKTVSRDRVSSKCLESYGIPYEVHPNDPNYYLLDKQPDKKMLEMLHKQTKELRRGHNSSTKQGHSSQKSRPPPNPVFNIDNVGEEKMYSSRRRSRSASHDFEPPRLDHVDPRRRHPAYGSPPTPSGMRHPKPFNLDNRAYRHPYVDHAYGTPLMSPLDEVERPFFDYFPDGFLPPPARSPHSHGQHRGPGVRGGSGYRVY
ncbi:hypothetical protein ACLMJK_001716 [Lecanora helva]